MMAATHITTDQALDAAADMIVTLMNGLVTTPEGRENVMLEMISGLSKAQGGNAAEAEIMRRVVERLRRDFKRGSA